MGFLNHQNSKVCLKIKIDQQCLLNVVNFSTAMILWCVQQRQRQRQRQQPQQQQQQQHQHDKSIIRTTSTASFTTNRRSGPFKSGPSRPSGLGTCLPCTNDEKIARLGPLVSFRKSQQTLGSDPKSPKVWKGRPGIPHDTTASGGFRTWRQKTLLRDAWPMWPSRQTGVLKLNVLQLSWHFPLFHLYTCSCSIHVFHREKNKEVHFHLPLPPSFFRIECHVFLSSLEFHSPQTFRKHRKFHSSFVARAVAFHVAQGLLHRGEVLVMVICWCLGKCTGIIWDIPSGKLT